MNDSSRRNRRRSAICALMSATVLSGSRLSTTIGPYKHRIFNLVGCEIGIMSRPTKELRDHYRFWIAAGSSQV